VGTVVDAECRFKACHSERSEESALPGTPALRKLDEAMRQLVGSVQDTNPGLRATGNPVNISVGGRAAKSMEMLGKSVIRVNGEPIAERIRLVALQGKGSLVLYMAFVAPDADFDSMRPTFDRIMRSFAAR